MRKVLGVSLAGILTMIVCAREPQPWPVLKPASDKSPLPGTEVLDWEGDLAMRMVDGIDEWLDGEIEANRETIWEERGTTKLTNGGAANISWATSKLAYP